MQNQVLPPVVPPQVPPPVWPAVPEYKPQLPEVPPHENPAIADEILFVKCLFKGCLLSTPVLAYAQAAIPINLQANKYFGALFQLAYDYFAQYKKAPRDDFALVLEEYVNTLKCTPEITKMYYRHLEVSLDAPKVSDEHLINRAAEFVRKRTLVRNLHLAADKLNEGEVDEAENLLIEHFRAPKTKTDLGLIYGADNEQHGAVQQNILMPTGIAYLDVHIKGLHRSQLVCLAGGPKSGKSMALLHFAAQALRNKLKVVYISHELHAHQIESRLDQHFGMLTSEKEPIPINIFSFAGAAFAQAHTYTVQSIHNPEARKVARDEFRRTGGRLVIKKYPPHSATMKDLEAYLHMLEHQGFTPDVIINDYPDIMALEGKDYRHALNTIYLQHKRLADERNALVLIVTQTNREAERKKKTKAYHTAEDFRKNANVDMLIGISTGSGPRVAELEVLMNRDGPQGVGCQITQCFEIGRFAIDSAPTYVGVNDNV